MIHQDNYNLNKLSPDNHLKVDNDYLDKTLTDEIDTIKDFSTSLRDLEKICRQKFRLSTIVHFMAKGGQH